MQVLVTGGAGYIGSHVCKALAALGHVPIAYDNLSRGNPWAARWGPLEIGDIADSARLREVFERHAPAAIMHLAAYAYIAESIEHPSLYYENNVGGSATLFRAMAEWKVVPVVFSSTCATYGVPDTSPISEDHPQRPINPYGYSKLVVERMLSDMERARGMRSVSLRFSNAAGADPDGEIGEAHDPEPHLIPRVLAAARDGVAVTVYGNDYATPDGTCIRDYVHVTDIACAHVRALDYLLAGGTSCALNLANARGYSVLEVIETARRVTGRTIDVKVLPRRQGDPPALVGAGDRARRVLGWTSARSTLETQIADAWRWMQRQSARAGR